MKSMKKSMAITTILMVVLLVVALSTATFAWYSAQSSVSVSKTAITSASTSSASLALSATKDLMSDKTSMSLTMSSTTLNPMLPKSIADEIGYDDFSKGFQTCIVDNKGIASNVSTASAAVINAVRLDGDSSDSTLTGNGFWVMNTNYNADVNVDVKVTIPAAGYSYVGTITEEAFGATGAEYYVRTGNDFERKTTGWTAGTEYYVKNANIAKYLRVAVFVGDDVDGENEAQLLAVWAIDKKAYYKIMTDADDTTATGYYSEYSCLGSAETAQISIGAADGACIRVFVWFDGTQLKNANANCTAIFQIDFAAATAGGSGE